MIEQILKGGLLMIPLMLCSLICLAVVYDRWFAFRDNRRIDTRSLRSKVLARLRENDIPGAIRECEAARGPVASVLLAGLRSYHQLRGKQEGAETMRLVVGQVMEDYSAQALSATMQAQWDGVLVQAAPSSKGTAIWSDSGDASPQRRQW